jgi:carboxymethylenebutenolidase
MDMWWRFRKSITSSSLRNCLAYDQAGSDRGNELKYTKPLESYDGDTDLVVTFLAGQESCTGRIGSYGVCLGGHLAVRAGFHPGVSAVAAFYPTDVHSSSLGAGRNDDTLKRLGQSRTPMMFVWGRQDPHVPLEGRLKIAQRLNETEAEFGMARNSTRARFCVMMKVRATIPRSPPFAPA